MALLIRGGRTLVDKADPSPGSGFIDSYTRVVKIERVGDGEEIGEFYMMMFQYTYLDPVLYDTRTYANVYLRIPYLGINESLWKVPEVAIEGEVRAIMKKWDLEFVKEKKMKLTIATFGDMARFGTCILGRMRKGEYACFDAEAQSKARKMSMIEPKLYLATFTNTDTPKSVLKEATSENWDAEAESTSYMHTPIVYLVDVGKFEVSVYNP